MKTKKALGRPTRDEGTFFNPALVDDSNLGLGMFLEEACEIGEEFEVRFGLLYETYRSWCLEQGELPLRRTAFGRRLGGDEIGGVWQGIRLRKRGGRPPG